MRYRVHAWAIARVDFVYVVEAATAPAAARAVRTGAAVGLRKQGEPHDIGKIRIGEVELVLDEEDA